MGAQVPSSSIFIIKRRMFTLYFHSIATKPKWHLMSRGDTTYGRIYHALLKYHPKTQTLRYSATEGYIIQAPARQKNNLYLVHYEFQAIRCVTSNKSHSTHPWDRHVLTRQNTLLPLLIQHLIKAVGTCLINHTALLYNSKIFTRAKSFSFKAPIAIATQEFPLDWS